MWREFFRENWEDIYGQLIQLKAHTAENQKETNDKLKEIEKVVK